MLLELRALMVTTELMAEFTMELRSDPMEQLKGLSREDGSVVHLAGVRDKDVVVILVGCGDDVSTPDLGRIAVYCGVREFDVVMTLVRPLVDRGRARDPVELRTLSCCSCCSCEEVMVTTLLLVRGRVLSTCKSSEMVTAGASLDAVTVVLLTGQEL